MVIKYCYIAGRCGTFTKKSTLLALGIITPTNLNIAPLKHLLEIMLVPPHLRLQPRKLPYPIDLGVVMLISGMRVALQLDLLQRRIGIHLMRSTQLVVADNLGVRDALPACHAEQVLGLDTWVAEEVVVGHHGHEFGGGHVVPAWLADVGVVNEECWGDDAAETRPVLEKC